MRGKTLSFLHIVQHTKMERGASRATFPRGAWERSIGRHQEEISWLSGRLREQARSYSGMGVPARDWSAVRPPSRASLAPTVEWGYLQRDWSAARPPSRASLAPTVECGYLQRDWSAVRPPSRASLAPTVEWVYLQEIGRLSGRLRGQASLLQGVRCTRFALHHSLGRALARLLLILIHPPLSGG
jgi:hypothetical protein